MWALLKKTATRHLLTIKKDTSVIIKKRLFINFLHVLGFKSRNPNKKRFPETTHVTNRLNACKKWLFWTNSKWKQIIFLDETKTNPWSSEKIQKIWRRDVKGSDSNSIISTVKYAGGLAIFWGCFGYYDVEKLVLINELINKF